TILALVFAVLGAVGTVWLFGLYAAPVWQPALVTAAWAIGAAWLLSRVEARAYRRWRERDDARYDRAVEALNR
ncbi:hypothetical protein NL287_26615, partial [Klebsiella pneumoniae]|nr:hypothetical protein [Klebsiella pneumoniae]